MLKFTLILSFVISIQAFVYYGYDTSFLTAYYNVNSKNRSVALFSARQSGNQKAVPFSDKRANLKNLEWTSERYPELELFNSGDQLILDPLNYFSPDKRDRGFRIQVNILPNELKNAYVERMKFAYGLIIKPEQIKPLFPKKFECSIVIENTDYIIFVHGKANNLSRNPISVEFSDSINSGIKRVVENGDLDITCDDGDKVWVLNTATALRKLTKSLEKDKKRFRVCNY